MRRDQAQRLSELLATAGYSHVTTCAVMSPPPIVGPADFEVLLAPDQALDLTHLAAALAANGWGIRHGVEGVPPPGFTFVPPAMQLPEGMEEEVEAEAGPGPSRRPPDPGESVCYSCMTNLAQTGGRHALGCPAERGQRRYQPGGHTGGPRPSDTPVADGDFGPPPPPARPRMCPMCARPVGQSHQPSCPIRSVMGSTVVTEDVAA